MHGILWGNAIFNVSLFCGKWVQQQPGLIKPTAEIYLTIFGQGRCGTPSFVAKPKRPLHHLFAARRLFTCLLDTSK